MCLQPLVQQSPHLLLQGFNLVANWLERRGEKLKVEIRNGHNKYGRRGEAFEKVRWYDGCFQAVPFLTNGVSEACQEAHITHRHAHRHTYTSPAGAITGSGRRDYLAILSCRAILGCSWKFTLCPCVFFPLSRSLSPFSFLPPSLLSLSLTGQYFRLQI